MTGTTVLHYKVGELLGSGGMGEVYRAEDTRLGREVALKFLPASFDYDPDRHARFLREARAASALRSPNIAAIFDIGEHEGKSFIVMEYVEGESLARRIGRGPLPVRDAIDIAMQVADALDEAHARGVVHRDIKSANLIVTARGLVKVLDFGLAKFARGPGGEVDSLSPTLALDPKETVAGALLGTASYMSPEQALGRRVDHRSDLFSLGVVLYEMLAGRLPFTGAGATEIIDRIVHDEPPALARFNYEVPADLDHIVRKALEKDASFRYQAARDLSIDLRNLSRRMRDQEGSERVGVGGTGPTDRPTLSLDGRQAAAHRARIENAVAVMTFTNISKEPADEWIGSGIAESVTADLKNIHDLPVIGRERMLDAIKSVASADRAPSEEALAIELGRRLGAAWVITGGYQRMTDLIRITARLVDVATGNVARIVKIDGRIAEIFDLQDKIVYELSRGLNLTLGGTELAAIEHDETQSVEAYEHFSRGMINLRAASPEALDRAIYLFERALEYDPAYASAWAALGAAFDLKATFLSLPDLAHRAIECERKAIELDPGLVRAYEWLAGAFITLDRFDEAIEVAERALRLDPESVGPRMVLARAYWIGKGMIEEGITELERVVAISPNSGYGHLQLGFLCALTGDYARAEAACRAAVALQERYISGKVGLLILGARTRLGYVYYLQGRYEDAVREYEREAEFLSTIDHALKERSFIELNQKLGAAMLKQGLGEEAERFFERAIEAFESRLVKGADDPSTRYYVACAYALRGDADKALEHLEGPLERLPALTEYRVRVDPDLAAVRQDPRLSARLAPAE